MKASPGITFLWGGVKGHGGASDALSGFFPLSFHPPLIIPFLIVFTITTCETWADTLASMEASRLDVTGKALQIMRQKGALLNDTLSGIFAALSGVLPLSAFSQRRLHARAAQSLWRACLLAQHTDFRPSQQRLRRTTASFR